jgi:hypothetical protein
VVEAVAGVVRVIASVVGAIADEDVVDADRICASSMVVAVKLLTPVVEMICVTPQVFSFHNCIAFHKHEHH